MRGGDVFGLVGTTLADKFRVERLLGEGGFGVVYGGTHLVLGVPVAIKCLKPVGVTEAQREHNAQAFLREARILFGLGHPSIVRLYDVGVVPQGQVPYAVLELLRGPTLQDEITTRAVQGKRFDKDELVSIFAPIFEAVGYAHERGIVHRDLKPANLMLVTDGHRATPKVLDFGTARGGLGTGEVVAPSAFAASVAAGSERTGFTPLYAAPEQWDAAYGATGPATDVFSLGLTLFEACLLAYPFDVSGGLMAIWRAVSDDRRPPLRTVRPDLPDELEEVLRRATRVRSSERYADARELCASFRTAMKATVETAPLMRPLAAAPPSSLPDTMPVNEGISQLRPAIAAQAVASQPRVSHPVGSRPTPFASAATPAPGMGPPPPQMGYAPPFGSTTQGHAFQRGGAPSKGSPLPWILGGGALVIAFFALVVAGAAVFVRSAATDPVAAPAPAPTTPTIRVGTGTAPAPLAPKPKVVATAGPKKALLESVTGGEPCWTQAELVSAAKAHEPAIQRCVDASAKNEPTIAGDITLIMQPVASGKMQSVMCTFDHDEEEATLCACVQVSMATWKMPPSHGKLGALDAVNFIVTYKVRNAKP